MIYIIVFLMVGLLRLNISANTNANYNTTSPK
jgi:hypothetical protein